MDLSRAELRFGLSDPRGLGANPHVNVAGQPLRLQPGGGSSGGRGFFAWVDASGLAGKPLVVDFAYDFRGNGVAEPRPPGGRHALDGALVLAEPELRRRLPPGARKVARQRLRRQLSHRQSRAWPVAGQHRRCRPPTLAAARRTCLTRGAGGAMIQAAQISLIQPVDLIRRSIARPNTASCSSASPSSRC